jgi:tRNA pseudouridine38-40 synthase
VARLIEDHDDFLIFSKAHSDVKTTICKIYHCQWTYYPEEDRMIFEITADRFLRGMIRLIVGCTINVARGKLAINDLKYSLDNNIPLKNNWSVPAQGLFLSQVLY